MRRNHLVKAKFQQQDYTQILNVLNTCPTYWFSNWIAERRSNQSTWSMKFLSSPEPRAAQCWRTRPPSQHEKWIQNFWNSDNGNGCQTAFASLTPSEPKCNSASVSKPLSFLLQIRASSFLSSCLFLQTSSLLRVLFIILKSIHAYRRKFHQCLQIFIFPSIYFFAFLSSLLLEYLLFSLLSVYLLNFLRLLSN